MRPRSRPGTCSLLIDTSQLEGGPVAARSPSPAWLLQAPSHQQPSPHHPGLLRVHVPGFILGWQRCEAGCVRTNPAGSAQSPPCSRGCSFTGCLCTPPMPSLHPCRMRPAGCGRGHAEVTTTGVTWCGTWGPLWESSGPAACSTSGAVRCATNQHGATRGGTGLQGGLGVAPRTRSPPGQLGPPDSHRSGVAVDGITQLHLVEKARCGCRHRATDHHRGTGKPPSVLVGLQG